MIVCVILFIDNTFTHKSNVHISVYIVIYKSVSIYLLIILGLSCGLCGQC